MAEEVAPITFNIKASNDAKYVLTLPLSTSILDLKKKLSASEYADVPAERQRLIYSGRVLKDADTLETYQVKEGNTIHLVKSAASNQNQNSSNQGASTAASTASATHVPSNIATGTGNNPLAGLTGARYAGQVQLPGMGMFGPDGGMGAPPSADMMADMLSDPNMQATMNEALQNPQVIDMILQSQPAFRDNPGMRQMIQSPEFRRMMTDPDTIRSMQQIQRSLGGVTGQAGGFPAPGATTNTGNQGTEGNAATGATPGQAAAGQTAPGQAAQNLYPLAGINPMTMLRALQAQNGATAAANPFAALFGVPQAAHPDAANATPGSPTDTQGTRPHEYARVESVPVPSNADLAAIQQYLATLGAAGGTNPYTAYGGMTMQEQTQTADNRPPEERYASQLGQLNDMGFYDFDRNVEALRRTGGSVQGAIEYLLHH